MNRSVHRDPAARTRVVFPALDNCFITNKAGMENKPIMAPMIIICTPIFLPVVKAFGVDPIHFGVILILNAGIGLNTPPVGSVQFVACAIGRISIGESMRTIWPFYGASVAVLLLVTYVPGLSLWLPRLFH